MSDNSRLYRGWVMHSRRVPRPHRFRYRVWWLLADLDELDGLSRSLRLFSHNRFNLFALYDRDYGDGSGPLRPYVEQRLAEAGLSRAATRIELLTMPRLLGYAFNPLSVYFCSDKAGRLAAIIYEVHNTFGERHSYVIEAIADRSGTVRQFADKAFYVSPFMDMAQRYAFRVCPPAEQVTVAVTGHQNGQTVIDTGLHGRSLPLTDAALLRCWVSHPLLTLKVVAAIHWEALRLWRKKFSIRPREPVRNHGATGGKTVRLERGVHG